MFPLTLLPPPAVPRRFPHSPDRRLALHLLALLGSGLLTRAEAARKPKPALRKQPASAALPAHGGLPGAYGERSDVRAWATAQTAAGAALAASSADEVIAVVSSARYLPQVARLILPPPSGVAKDWGAYRDRFIEARRLQAGLRFWAVHEAALAQAESRYGVPAALVMGILGVETFYGQIMGSFRVLDALATLGFDFPAGRSDRSAFFRDELAALLLLARAEGRPASDFKGSYAGAMGLGQFMPSSWRAHAVDFDGDGHIDLSNNAADAIGSIAHFLVQHGWQPGQPTHIHAQAPADAAHRARLLAPDIDPRWSHEAFQEAGLSLNDAEHALVRAHGPWALVALENGGAAPTYVLGSRNFWVVTRYNRSAYYALAVISLGERLQTLRQAGLDG